MAFTSSLLSKAAEYQAVDNASSSNQYGISLMMAVPEDEPVIEIDSDLRHITIPDELYNIGVAGDHHCETIYFRIPRYFDGADLSSHDCIIRFINAGNEYGEENVCNVEIFDEYIKFGWLIDRRATRYSGVIEFTVQFETIDDYQWQTVPAKLNILAGLNIEATITDRDDILFRSISNQIYDIQNLLDSLSIKTNTDSSLLSSLIDRVTALENEVSYLKNNVVYVLND